MGYQFVHLESYSRKPDRHGRTTNFIFGEAARRPEASMHVPSPEPPIVVYGVNVDAVQEMHDAAVASATVLVKGGKTRKVRADQKSLHTVIASHPLTMDEIRSEPDKRLEAERWERRTIEWLEDQYGGDLKSVIRHEDESHFHLHAYVVPLSDPEVRAARLHPGVTAKREVMAGGADEGEDTKALGKRADVAYKAAMRAWQDSYHQAVAVPCGLTRLGPQRRRLSRDEWQREKVQARTLQQVVQRARKVKADGETYIDRTKIEAAKIATNAAREQEAARKAIASALAEQDRARQEREHAKAALADAAKYSSWAGRLRAIWDRLRESKLVEKVRHDLAREIEHWRDAARIAERKQLEAEKQRYEAERKSRDAQDEAMRAGIERDRLRSILSPTSDLLEGEPSLTPKLDLKRNFKKKEKERV